METTASIPTKFCTVVKTTKRPAWVVQSLAQQIQDGGRPPSEKNRKISISLCNSSIDFDQIWHGEAVQPS